MSLYLPVGAGEVLPLGGKGFLVLPPGGKGFSVLLRGGKLRDFVLVLALLVGESD